MSSKQYWPGREPTGRGTDGRFEQLRDQFYRRLGDDREQLQLLTTELSGLTADAMPTFELIRLLAHRICGAASFYENVAIRETAGALEYAAVHAIRMRAKGDDVGVSLAIEALRSSLQILSAIGEQDLNPASMQHPRQSGKY
jgi:hypothetical protein